MKFYKPLLLLLILSAAGQAQTGFSPYYEQRKSLFEALPDSPHAIIFLGNSITDGGEWNELFADTRIKNRGISSDITAGVLNRLAEVTGRQPDKVFIMIGVNDLSLDIPLQQILANYKEIVRRIQQESPHTRIYLQSVLPVNPAFERFKKHTNKSEHIVQLNNRLDSLCQAESLRWIDLHSRFADENGHLHSDLTNDGLHLMGRAYLLWKEIVQPFIDEE